MLKELDEIERSALASLRETTDDQSLEQWRVAHLGRKAPLLGLLGGLGSAPPEERPAIGKRGNEVKRSLEQAFQEALERNREENLRRSLRETLDVTLPGRPIGRGRLHPATRTLRRIAAVWAEMGFQIYRSREVETDEFNFGYLNMPPHHPARDMWDTFHTTRPGVILRTHTSPGQIRAMREFCPAPIRVILPGMCYRYEQITSRSEIQFNQVEGLAVGKRISFSDLKGTLTDFARRLFGSTVQTRFRAAHFPFTEPSAEMDVECFVCGGAGCPICKQTGWLEILGCGMVHPVVLENGGYDPTIFSGYAFGMGPERITMLMHRIDDIRNFWNNDTRFLEQF